MCKVALRGWYPFFKFAHLKDTILPLKELPLFVMVNFSLSSIISMLQIICLDESNEILDYTYYGFEGNKNRRKGKIHVQAALKNDNYIPKVLRIYLGCKLSRRIYVNLGEKDVVNHLCEIMTVILKIVEDMLNAPDFFTMFSIASFHLKNLDLLD